MLSLSAELQYKLESCHGYLTAETNVKLCVQGKRKGRIRLNSILGEGERGNEGEKEEGKIRSTDGH